jgi:16S rRNA (cytidine1402-2'-O)-methyltransferase
LGTLYVVATPIGNLGDLSPRALEVLAGAGLIAAEDTRVTARLKARFGLTAPTRSLHEHTPPGRVAALVHALETSSIALVSDAGTPGVSDPGARLVRGAREAGHEVVAVPGPSAPAAALSVSGFAADRYTFLGFLPRAGTERRRLRDAARVCTWAVVLFEAPHRLRQTLADLAADDPERGIAVCRELTKAHEEVWVGDLEGALGAWTEREPRGEFTLVLAPKSEAEPEAWSDERVTAELRRLAGAGVGAKAAAREVAPLAGRSSREVYALWPLHDGP